MRNDVFVPNDRAQKADRRTVEQSDRHTVNNTGQ